MIHGLGPILSRQGPILILGSMPSAASIAARQYYAHPRNRFWPLMEMLFGIDASLPYAQRVEGLAQAGASLWDVVAECERPGSADSRIVRSSVRLNDLASFVAELPELRAIAFNGGEAFRAFIEGHRGYVTAGERLSIRFGSRSIEAFKMPSTSPANAAFSLERLYGSWFPLAEPR